jgi:hypothetical protein
MKSLFVTSRAHREDSTVRAFGGIMKFRAAICGEREYDA